MFDHNDCCAGVEKRLKYTEQYLHIKRVQTDRRLIKYEHGIRLCSADLTCQFEPLCLAARKPRCFFTERQISKTELLQDIQPLADGFHIPAEIHCGVHIHIHQLGERNTCAILVCEIYTVSRSCIARAAAIGAGNVHIRQKLHIKTDNTRAVTAGATQRTCIVGKIACLIAFFLCTGGLGVELSQFVVNTCISGNGRADIDSDGRCVNQLDMRNSVGTDFADVRRKCCACNACFQRGNKAFQNHGRFA